MSSLKNGLKALYGSKAGKILPVLIIAGLVATASASVFVVYYGHSTATVATPDVKLLDGTDTASTSSYKPTVSIATSGDFATIGITFFPSVTQTPTDQPNIFYTDLLHVNNAGASPHTISSIVISNVVDASTSLGEIDVYYCTSQTNTPATSASCASFAITNTAGGSLSGNAILPASLAAAANGYIEIAGHAASGATAANTVTFNLQIQWA